MLAGASKKANSLKLAPPLLTLDPEVVKMHSAFLWKLLALLLIVLLAVGSTHGAKSRYDKRIEDKDDDDEDGDTETEDDDYIQPPAPSHRVKG